MKHFIEGERELRKQKIKSGRFSNIDNYDLAVMNQDKKYNIEAKTIINFEGKLRYSHMEKIVLPVTGIFQLESETKKKEVFAFDDSVELPPDFTLPD